MSRSLRRRLERLERRRAALLAKVTALPPSVVDARPSPAVWSIREILEHLMLAERSVFMGMPEPAALVARRRRMRGFVGYVIVWAVLRFGIRVRVPAADMEPSGSRTLDEVRTMWDENQVWLRACLEALHHRRERGAVFRHPVTGPLTARQALRLMEVHLLTHSRQIRRRLR